MNKNLLIVIVAMIMIAVSWLLGRWLQSGHVETVERAQAIICNPAEQPCEAKFSDTTVTLHFEQPPTALQSFGVGLVASVDISQAFIEFHMKDMEMGPNRVTLNKTADGWHADAILPVCVSGRRDWIARLMIEYQGQWRQAEYNFEVN
jgi:hypothetical protein